MRMVECPVGRLNSRARNVVDLFTAVSAFLHAEKEMLI